MRGTEIAPCIDCGDHHLGRCGGLSFVQRLRSVRLDLSLTQTRTRRNYYDRESLDDMFGEDEATRKERYWDETKGMGAVKRGDIAKLDDKALDFYLGADMEEDGAL